MLKTVTFQGSGIALPLKTLAGFLDQNEGRLARVRTRSNIEKTAPALNECLSCSLWLEYFANLVVQNFKHQYEVLVDNMKLGMYNELEKQERHLS